MEAQTLSADIRRWIDPAAAARRGRRAVRAAVLAAVALAPAAAAAGAGRDDPVGDVGAARDDAARSNGVTGRVVDARGAPVSGALVVPAPAGSAAVAVPDMAVLTDGDGRFSWPLGPGRYRLDVVVNGRVAGSAPAMVGGERPPEVRIVIGGDR